MRDYSKVAFERKGYKAAIIIDTDLKTLWKKVRGADVSILGVPVSILFGINVVLISKISFGAIVPDFFQKVKTTKDVLLGSFIGFVPAGLIAGTIGAVLTISTGTYDIVKILGILNLSFLAYLFLSVSSFAPATIYPAGVGIASILNKNDERSRVVGTIIAGAIGTFLAFFNMLDKFTQFLNILGIAFAPIMGVMLTDYYIIKNSSNIKIIKLSGLFSWLIGAVVVYITSDIFTFGIAY